MKLLDKVTLKENSSVKTTDLTPIVQLFKELGLAGDFLGREFEVKDAEGKLIYTVTQKGLGLNQINILLEELDTLNRLEKERMENEQKKGKSYKKGNSRSR